MASSSSRPPADAGEQVDVGCDGDCEVDADCGDGQRCTQFADAKKCAPAECRTCKKGCVFDLRDCTFSRCEADAPAGSGCGQACSSSADCGSGQVCAQIFGAGECAPPQCARCEGFCDYSFDTCAYSACYVSTGAPAAADPWYCGHQF